MNNYINSKGFISSQNYDGTNNLFITGSVYITGSIIAGSTSLKTISGYTYVVGNSSAGDTVNDCHYLDAGDCVQLRNAIAAASTLSPVGCVFVKRGNFAITSAINVPNNVSLIAEGYGTVFNVSGTNRKAFSFQSLTLGENLNINVPVPISGSTGTEVVDFGAQAYFHRCKIVMATQTLSQAMSESLRYGYRSTSITSGPQMSNVTIIAPSFRTLGLSQDFIGIEITASTPGGRRSELIQTNVQGADIGYLVAGGVSIIGGNANTVGRIGFQLQAMSGWPYFAPSVIGGSARILNVAGLQQFGAVITTGDDAAGPLAAKISNVSFFGTSTNTGSAAISLQGTGTGSIVVNNSIQGFPIGITASSTNQTYAIVQENVIKGATTALAVTTLGSLTSSNVIFA